MGVLSPVTPFWRGSRRNLCANPFQVRPNPPLISAKRFPAVHDRRALKRVYLSITRPAETCSCSRSGETVHRLLRNLCGRNSPACPPVHRCHRVECGAWIRSELGGAFIDAGADFCRRRGGCRERHHSPSNARMCFGARSRLRELSVGTTGDRRMLTAFEEEWSVDIGFQAAFDDRGRRARRAGTG